MSDIAIDASVRDELEARALRLLASSDKTSGDITYFGDNVIWVESYGNNTRLLVGVKDGGSSIIRPVYATGAYLETYQTACEQGLDKGLLQVAIKHMRKIMLLEDLADV